MFLPLQLLPARLQADDFSKTWDQVASAITERYYARQQRKAAMDGLLARYGPLAKKAGSRGQFESIVNQMIRDFHDSHFGFFTTSDQGFYLMDALIKHAKAKEMPEFGAWFAADGYTVTMVLDDSEAQRAGLRKRDTVTEVDGQPFSPVDSLRALVGKQAGLTVMRAGATLHPSVKISSEGALQMFLDASRASARIIEYHGKKIGYFHLWTQADPEFRTSLENAVFGHLRETDGFILDLRDGFGGRPEGYGDPFFRPSVWLDWRYGPKTGYRELFGYGKPLAVVINGGSRSAKEVLSYVFKKSGRGTLVGQTTAGNVLGTFPQAIGDWAYIEVPMLDVLADGVRLEGNGVVPDVAVPSEFGAGGKDLDLSAALEKLADGK